MPLPVTAYMSGSFDRLIIERVDMGIIRIKSLE
jgi:hypothetical protein